MSFQFLFEAGYARRWPHRFGQTVPSDRSSRCKCVLAEVGACSGNDQIADCSRTERGNNMYQNISNYLHTIWYKVNKNLIIKNIKNIKLLKINLIPHFSLITQFTQTTLFPFLWFIYIPHRPFLSSHITSKPAWITFSQLHRISLLVNQV